MESKIFLKAILDLIKIKDSLHFKKIQSNIFHLENKFPNEYNEFTLSVKKYFDSIDYSSEQIVGDYLKMIRDMRIEGLYFHKNGTYRCNNQKEANEYVYSNPEIMTYYMNALLISQLLWKHHFYIFLFFKSKIKSLFRDNSKLSILDVGPGHGFYSQILKNEFVNYKNFDIVDISLASLNMTKVILGLDDNKIRYYQADIFKYENKNDNKYDLICLGEVLEHLDNPKSILLRLSQLLKPNGILWITTPTNSPAIDHVYLFKTKEEVFTLIRDANFDIFSKCNFFAEDMQEEEALIRKATNLVGVFCKKRQYERLF